MRKLLDHHVALLLGLVVIGSVIFNVWSPWQFTEIASNWKFIDFTVMVTWWICGVAFVILGLFMAWAIWRYKYHESGESHYEPEHPVLESWLTIITAIGVVIMLAPGLIVWDDYIQVPSDAMEIEVLGEQWTWKFRFPGEDGILGTTAVKKNVVRGLEETTYEANMTSLNPFGMRDDDPYGEDDILVASNILHVPLGRNIKMVLRSKDVLHDFWVPEIRAKMDMVPGMITYFWFRPTRTGEFEILCAELCGRGHHIMRGTMYIDTQEDFEAWLDTQVTWAEMKAGQKPESPIVAKGRQIADQNGCFACHSLDGTEVVGPTWQGLWNREITLSDGSVVVADEAYIIESIVDPAVKLVEGYGSVMTPYSFTDDEMAALLSFLQEATNAP
ncbi:MAG: cytochrome c oxidase subunit II [Gammaproteobacteria bacterium]|nr:cytochrome c oxidase subunit II [Gammaproteobacteria bacterium]